jgi:hypothetical protein
VIELKNSTGTNRRGSIEQAFLIAWFVGAAVYACAYYHTFFQNMAVHFLRLPEKAPAIWRWLDHLL